MEDIGGMNSKPENTVNKIYLKDISTPAFLVDIKKVRTNCENMREMCKKMRITLRAQVKTHKTIEGAILQTGLSKRCIVTSTMSECEVYAANGFDDILYGFPLTPEKISRCAAIMDQITEFHVLVDNKFIVEKLSNMELPKNKSWSIFVKVDCGNNRVGVWWEDSAGIELCKTIANNKKMVFQGIYVHCGNSYYAAKNDGDDTNQATLDNVEEIAKETIGRTQSFVERLRDGAGVEVRHVGVGSTPSCSRHLSEFQQLTEIHPGNYIFYDVQQVSLGSCGQQSIACRVMTRVVGHYPRRNQLLIDAGFTALTKQCGVSDGGGAPVYGLIQDHPELRIVGMTQEIGKVEPCEGRLNFDAFPIGSVIFIYPWHSCATAYCHPVFYVHEEDEVFERWVPNRGW